MPDPRAVAFEHSFRADHPALVAFCFRRTGDYELARDIAADTFRIAWSRWDEPRRSDRAWLFGVARNLIGNEYSRRRHHQWIPLGSDGAHDPVDERSVADYSAIDVQTALAALSPAHQEVLRLTYWEGLSAAETAESLHTTTAATWVRLTRARRAFANAWHGQATNPNAPTRTSA